VLPRGFHDFRGHFPLAPSLRPSVLRPLPRPRPPRNDLRRAARFKASHRLPRSPSFPPFLLLLLARIARNYNEHAGKRSCSNSRNGGGYRPPSAPLITPARIRSFVSFAMVTRPDAAAACHSKDDNDARASPSRSPRKDRGGGEGLERRGVVRETIGLWREVRERGGTRSPAARVGVRA